MSNPPQVSVFLDVPEGCRMQGEFTGDLDIQIRFGEPSDGAHLLFEREALKRFVELAKKLLAAPVPEDRKAALPVLTA
jgi:hypothetical protein